VVTTPYRMDYPDATLKPGHAVLAHVRRHRFIYLSLALHAALVGGFYKLHHAGALRSERARQQQAIDAGERLTQQGRLEKRVHDMARIESLLEQSAAGSRTQARPHEEDEVLFSAQPKAPTALLKQATELSRKIEHLERDTEAAQLAKLLRIPKEKALKQIEAARKPQAPPGPAPGKVATADVAKQIAQLEGKARAVLERRRQQLARERNGTPVTAGAMRGDADGSGGSSRRRNGSGSGNSSSSGNSGGQDRNAAQGGHAGPEGASTGGGGVPSVLDRMTAFTNPDMPEGVTKAYAAGGLQDFFDGGIGHMPVLDAGTIVKGSGRMIGPGGPYANRVYINRWYLIGPFEGRHGEGLFANAPQPPEQAVVLDAVYRGKDGRLLKWDYVDMARYPLIPPDAAEDAVYYGYTELMMAREQDLTIWVGADDDAQLWLNDRLVWRGGNVNKRWFFGEIYGTWNSYVRDYNLSEGKRVLHFRQGRNKLFFKLANGPTRLFFSLVLTK
jgi:hypothetical protein